MTSRAGASAAADAAMLRSVSKAYALALQLFDGHGGGAPTRAGRADRREKTEKRPSTDPARSHVVRATVGGPAPLRLRRARPPGAGGHRPPPPARGGGDGRASASSHNGGMMLEEAWLLCSIIPAEDDGYYQAPLLLAADGSACLLYVYVAPAAVLLAAPPNAPRNARRTRHIMPSRQTGELTALITPA